MQKRIVYQEVNGPVVVLEPCQCGLTIEQIAGKDVPKGVPFWVISTSDIPTDRTFRDAWELDVIALGKPTGFGGAV